MPNGVTDLRDVYDAVNELAQNVTAIGENVKNLSKEVVELKTDVKDIKSCLNEDRIKIALVENSVEVKEKREGEKTEKLEALSKEVVRIKSIEDAIVAIKENKKFWTDKTIYIIISILSISAAIGIAVFK